MGISLFSITADDDSLLGDSQQTVFASATANGIASLRNAFQPTTLPIDVNGVDSITLTLLSTAFIIPIYKWTELRNAASGNTLGENSGTGLKVYDSSGTYWILVGKTKGNNILVQTGNWSTTESTFVVRVDITRFLGGLLDHRIDSNGVEHRFVMQANSSSTPNSPGKPHYNGKRLADVWESGSVLWRQAGLYSGLTITHLAFGSARYDTLSARWIVSDNWQIIDVTDSTLINFAPTWTGNWVHPYVFADHKYARIRRENGAFSVYALSPEVSAVGRDWQLLSETYINGSNYAAEPYTTPLNFDLIPSDWRIIKFSWDWADRSSVISGETYYDRGAALMDINDLVIMPQQTRDRTEFAGRTSGALLFDITRYDIKLVRSGEIVPFGAANRLGMNCYFETNDSNSNNPPAKVFRIHGRHNSSRTITGWLRTWVY